MSLRLNLTDLATEFHLSNGRALTILRQAGIERDGHKLYDADDARAVIAEAIDPSRATGNRTAGRAGGASSPEIAALAEVRIRSEAARAAKLELENNIKAGKLIDRESVSSSIENIAAAIRNALLGVPAKIADRLVGKPREDIVATLDAEIRHALTSLADFEVLA